MNVCVPFTILLLQQIIFNYFSLTISLELELEPSTFRSLALTVVVVVVHGFWGGFVKLLALTIIYSS